VGRTVEKSWVVVARVGGGKGLVKFDDEIWD
jgi:membrane protein implicated in regulation of membrane protease activity